MGWGNLFSSSWERPQHPSLALILTYRRAAPLLWPEQKTAWTSSVWGGTAGGGAEQERLQLKQVTRLEGTEGAWVREEDAGQLCGAAERCSVPRANLGNALRKAAHPTADQREGSPQLAAQPPKC